MSIYEPTKELILMLIDVKEYLSAANVELAFVDSFEGCSDLMAAEILKSARSGDNHALESLVTKINDTIAFHHQWELDVTQVLLKDAHQNRDADCLKQALAKTKNVRRSLGRQIAVVTSSLEINSAALTTVSIRN